MTAVNMGDVMTLAKMRYEYKPHETLNTINLTFIYAKSAKAFVILPTNARLITYLI